MNDKICVFGNELCFEVESDLERYRVETILEKEPETIAWINGWSNASKSSIFFDIGANIGIYSLYATYKYPSLDVYSFEPVLNNYSALQRNVRLNRSQNIYPFNLALANENKLSNLYLSDTRIGNSGAQIDIAVNEKGEEYKALRVEKVLSISLDKLIFEYGLPVPTFVKIDVDGHETDILKGMLRALAQPELKSLLIEFNSQEEFALWQPQLADMDLLIDTRYDNLPNHSRVRRISKGTLARNYIFSRL